MDEEKETPFTSRTPSLHDLGAEEDNTPHRVPTYATVHDREGPPLEVILTQLSVAPQPGIPDGGFTAWLQVACGFFMFFNSWGLINAFGVWQDYYASTLIPNQSNSNISWIGSIEAFLLCCTSVFAGPMFDRGYARTLVFTGSFLVVFGLMMTSLCDAYWQLMLAQGICMGMGAGTIFITSVAIIPSYFTTKRALAIGVAASGSSLGGVIYPIVFHRLQPSIGFGWATRVCGFLALATLIMPCLCIRVRALPPPRKRIIDFSGFRELPFCLFCLAAFLGCVGLYIPFFYVELFATAKAGITGTLPYYMIPILSSGSIVGRILPGPLADRVGPLNVLSLCTVAAGILGLCWIAVHHTVAGLVIWGLLYGAFSGAFVSLQASSLISITDDMGMVGARLGMNMFCAALGILVGTPIAGVIVEKSWIGLQVFCGATLLAGAVLVMLTRWARVGWEVKRKA